MSTEQILRKNANETFLEEQEEQEAHEEHKSSQKVDINICLLYTSTLPTIYSV